MDFSIDFGDLTQDIVAAGLRVRSPHQRASSSPFWRQGRGQVDRGGRLADAALLAGRR